MTVHIVGAGLAGLAAAVQFAERGGDVVLHEATSEAGGRCRSYYDPGLGMTIDNGNHLLLSGNVDTRSYLRLIGAEDQLTGPQQAEFDFIDLANGGRWRLRPNAGRLPWWVLAHGRRVPGTKVGEYARLLRLLFAKPQATISDAMACSGPVFERVWRPLLLAALNTEPRDASAALAAAVVRETLARGGDACRPLVAANGLSRSFVDPALALLARRGVAVWFGRRLRAIEFAAGRAAQLLFGDDAVELGPGDHAVLAVPAWTAAELVPGLAVPDEYQAIVNGHFKVVPPHGSPMLLGVLNGTVEWIFAFADRVSVTVSAADRLLGVKRRELAEMFWLDIQAATGVATPLPPWQIVKEKRATFAALPGENRKRPGARTKWSNLFLAGDFTQTGLPATIEGAVRSGFRAAELALATAENS